MKSKAMPRSCSAALVIGPICVTEVPNTKRYRDVHSGEPAWVGHDWKRVEMTFDLRGFDDLELRTESHLNLFFTLPTRFVHMIDLTDISLIPDGAGEFTRDVVGGQPQAVRAQAATGHGRGRQGGDIGAHA